MATTFSSKVAGSGTSVVQYLTNQEITGASNIASVAGAFAAANPTYATSIAQTATNTQGFNGITFSGTAGAQLAGQIGAAILGAGAPSTSSSSVIVTLGSVADATELDVVAASYGAALGATTGHGTIAYSNAGTIAADLVSILKSNSNDTVDYTNFNLIGGIASALAANIPGNTQSAALTSLFAAVDSKVPANLMADFLGSFINAIQVLDPTPSMTLLNTLLGDAQTIVKADGFTTSSSTYTGLQTASVLAQGNPDAYNYGVLAGDETPDFNM